MIKIFRTLFLCCFIVILALPLVYFNTTPNAVSEIDNRKLMDKPLEAEGDRTDNIEAYINDRIGLRDKMILYYTILNDKLFNKMEHPMYTYGKDGYVFGSGITTQNDFGEFHIAYADMVKSIQDYCDARGVPFLFVFNPAKPAIFQDKLAAGINYTREWVNLFFAELDARGVRYVDNTVTLRAATDRGEAVFNKKYDANHWNSLGAYYGTRAALEALKETCPGVHIGDLSEYEVSTEKKTSLLVSKFPINEDVPVIRKKVNSSWSDAGYGLLRLDEQHRAFGYCVTPERKNEGAPRALVFQGSYMNGYGAGYFMNAFGEYVWVHDYENVIDFDYYYNIFRPECVVFEVAEYTFSNSFFNYERMKAIDYAPTLESLESGAYREMPYRSDEWEVKTEDNLTMLTYRTDNVSRYIWVRIGNLTYDSAEACEGGYRLTLKTEDYEAGKDSIRIFTSTEQ